VHLKRHFSYSDRIRYYWNTAEATAAVDRLMNSLVGITIPETLVSQYLPAQWRYAMQGDLPDSLDFQRSFTVCTIEEPRNIIQCYLMRHEPANIRPYAADHVDCLRDITIQ